MSGSSSSRPVWRTAAIVACVLMVALIAAWDVPIFSVPVLEQGDAGVNALQIDNAKHGREIYGNYSRFEFNHPGPAFFYVYAAAELIFHDFLGALPSPHNAHLLALIAMQVGFFALALVIIDSWFASPYLLLGALLGGAWHFSNTTGAFTSLWPPHVLLMPFLCFLAAGCSVAAGRTRDFLAFVLAGGFLFHGHVAQPLFVGGLGLLAFVLHLRSLNWSWSTLRAEIAAHRFVLWFCIGWSALLLLPLVVDLFRYGAEGNVATILGRFRSNASHGKSFLQSLLYFLSFSTYAVNQEDVFTRLGDATAQFFVDHALNLAGWTVAALVPAAIFSRKKNQLPESTRQFVSCAYLFLVATIALCVVWGLAQAGPMYQFNGFFYYGVYYFAGVLSLGVLLSIFPLPTKPIILTLGFCVAAISFTRGFIAPGLSANDTGQDIREAVDKTLRRNPDRRPKLVIFEHKSWPEAAAVLLELQRRGIPFYTAHSWNFMFGRQHDVLTLGPKPDELVDTWWLAPAGEAGVPVKNGLSLFGRRSLVDPQGTTVGFGFHQNSYRMVLSGLTTGNVDAGRADKPVVRFAFDVKPATNDVQLFVDLAAWNSAKQRVQIYWNERYVGEITATDKRAQPSVSIPASIWNAKRHAALELRLPDALPIDDPVRPSLHNWDSILLWHFWFLSATDTREISISSPKIGPLDTETANRSTRSYTPAINPSNDRLDFAIGQRGAELAGSGLGTPTASLTPIVDTHAALIFRALPATSNVQLEIVAEPYTTGPGRPPHQRCQLMFNGQLIFDAPFTEPGVIRVAILKEVWNSRPFGVIQLVLPDATPSDTPSTAVRNGLALRWLTARPTEN